LLYNNSKKKQVISKVKYADSIALQAKGLMFERKKNFDYALVFPFPRETRAGASIHMFFVFFPIAAVYLNSKMVVVDIAVLKPFALNYTPKKPAAYLIEMPVLAGKKIAVGDKLSIK